MHRNQYASATKLHAYHRWCLRSSLCLMKYHLHSTHAGAFISHPDESVLRSDIHPKQALLPKNNRSACTDRQSSFGNDTHRRQELSKNRRWLHWPLSYQNSSTTACSCACVCMCVHVSRYRARMRAYTACVPLRGELMCTPMV